MLLLATLSALTGCSGNHFDADHLLSDEIKSQSVGCTPEALTALNSVTEVCGKVLTEQSDKDLCVKSAKDYKVNYPGVVCNLEGEVVVTSTFIDDSVLDPLESEEEKLINSGIFDE